MYRGCILPADPDNVSRLSQASLPDGTFLIANGAQQGVAGFGLAEDPNLTALLYDPSQPIGQRISILNTTIVARLYHSEATVSRSLRTASSDGLIYVFTAPV